ncbi:MAG: hypothetical protein JXB14_04680 [Candidatus Altiarchaeota archaeon]|nr:hypothetical protein [Candidatus Altiarchaeota archaeon]
MRDVYVLVGLVVVILVGSYLGYNMTIHASTPTTAHGGPTSTTTRIENGPTKLPEENPENSTENNPLAGEENRTQDDAARLDDSWMAGIRAQISTDKYEYKSLEEMEISVVVDSPVVVGEVVIELRGILNDWGVSKLKLDKKTPLSEGHNVVKFDYTVPKCYGCAGLDPGTYSISAEVKYNDISLANTSTEVSIQK